MIRLPKATGSTLSFVSLLCMAAIVGGLLIANFYSQKSAQEQQVRRYQQNLEDHARGLEYFLGERENDIRELASSPVVRNFFTNRAMGMSMEYGLRASLQAIGRVFSQKIEAVRIGGTAIYDGFSLYDQDGKLLSSQGGSQVKQPHGSNQPLSSEVRMSSLGEGLICFSAPITLQGQVQGSVHGVLKYATFIGYLMGDLGGTFLLVDNSHQIVYRSQADPLLQPADLLPVFDARQRGSTTLRQRIISLAGESGNMQDFSAFSAEIPGYPVSIVLVEKSSITGQHKNQLVFMISLATLSGSAFLVAILIFRAGSRSLVLETSLHEATIRERAIAEKADQLQLVIDGAGLGTWNWQVSSGECLFNDQWFKIVGYQPGQLPMRVETWERLLHPDDKDRVLEAVGRHLEGQTDFYASEHRLKHASGKWIWVYACGKVLQRDAQGKASRAFGIHLDITERREASQLLRSAKEESDAIIRNFLDTLIVVDTNLLVSRVNQATCQLLGYDEGALIGMNIHRLFDEDNERINKVFTFHRQQDGAANDLNELRNVELTYRHADGGRLPMLFNLSLVRDENGKISGVIAGAKDISALRRALDDVHQQKEYIATLFDVVPEGLLAITSDHLVVEDNRAYKAILAQWADALALSEVEVGQQLIARIEGVHRNRQTSAIFSLSHNDRTVHCRCHLAPIANLGGIAHVIAITDITAERRNLEEKKLLATAIEQTDSSVLITDIDRRILYANSAAQRNSGYDLEELIGNTPKIFQSNLTDAAVYRQLHETLAQGQVWSGRLRNRRKNGQIYEEDVVISPVRNDEGQLSHYVAIKRDMTEMTTLQRQLLQAQKLEAIGQLAAGIAHEINTPMQYVQNNVTFFGQAFSDALPLFHELQKARRQREAIDISQLLEDLDLTFLLEEIPHALRETHEGIDRVVKIVSAMKAFSHPGSSSKCLTDINKALENTLTVCRNEYKYVAEVECSFDPELPLVPCFPDQLNQAMLNLIINAAHAIEATGASMPDNPGRITISTRREGTWAEIRIADSGSGIPEAIQPLIFDPFFTTKEVGKGTGQGLTIVHDVIAQKHGGTIDFLTREQVGTTFIIRLPLA